MCALRHVSEGLNIMARLHEIVGHEDHPWSPCDCQPPKWPAKNPASGHSPGGRPFLQ